MPEPSSGAVEIPALVLGGVALAKGGQEVSMRTNPLPENNTMANLMGTGHRAVVETLAQERRKVAAAFGVRNLPQNADWIAMSSGSASGKAHVLFQQHQNARQSYVTVLQDH